MDGFKKTACMCCWSTWSPCSAPNLESYLKWKHKTYFVGINKGSAIFLHLLKELQDETNPKRRVAFFHRNTSDERKREILEDLQLPLGSTEKQLICVVATVSLGGRGRWTMLLCLAWLTLLKIYYKRVDEQCEVATRKPQESMDTPSSSRKGI